MPGPFDDIRERLLAAGVAPRHVRRYLAELADHLADLGAEGMRVGLGPAEAEAAALVRLGSRDDLVRAMTGQRSFQSWSVRAPWAIFGLAPLVLLAAAYFVACMILWSGWRIFLPDAQTPFTRLGGPAIAYFGVGKLIYFGAPILIGCGLSLLAVRQRLGAAWPIVGIALIAMIASTAQVHASRQALAGAVRRVSMGFAVGASAQAVVYELVHALMIVAFSLLPLLLWRLGRALHASS